MDIFKSQRERISQQLAALTPSQKMLTGTLLAIMVMTLLWWAHYAGTADMEPVLDMALPGDDMARIQSLLTENHIDCKIVGDRVVVPSDRKLGALAILSYAGALPKNIESGFDEIIKQLSPWDGNDRQNAMFNHGKELTLSRVIGNFPEVASAAVVIDPHSEHHIENSVDPVAMVNIQLKQGMHVSRKLVDGVANLLVGSQSGLTMRNVHVVVDGHPQKVDDSSQDGTADPDQLRQYRQQEEQIAKKQIEELLKNIPDVLVSVKVSINSNSTVVDKTTFDTQKSYHVEKSVDSETHETTNPPAAPAEAGAGPNIGTSLTPAPGVAESGSTENKDRTEFTNAPAQETTHVVSLPGDTTITGASIRIPRSYYISLARDSLGGKDPDPKVLKQTIEEGRAEVRNSVLKGLALKSSSDLSVEVYADVIPVAATAPPIATASNVSMALTGHVKEIGLGALALLSLFMVSTMVKKSSPAMPQIAAAMPSGTPVLGVGDTLAGEAAEGNTLLSGMEMDEEAVRTQQMMDQVSTLVDENPDTAATLVKRWMNRG